MGGKERGQTTIDFTVGVGIFLLTLTIVFAFVPNLFAPFNDFGTAGRSAQAERVAEFLVDNLSVDGSSNELADDADDRLEANDGLRALSDWVGLNATLTNVNVTVVDSDGNSVADAGVEYNDQSSATASRVVTFENSSGIECSPVCRLIVRVW